MFITPITLPFPTPASILRRIVALEARITEAEIIARLRRSEAANQKAWEKQDALQREREAAAAAAREAQRALQLEQEAQRAAAREIERAAEAESLLRDRSLFVLLLQEGPEAVRRHLESQPTAESTSEESGASAPRVPHPAPVSAHLPPSSVLRPPSDRLHALQNLLLHAQHDIVESRRNATPIDTLDQFSSWGTKEAPGGPAAWRELLLVLQPIVHDQLNKNAFHLVNPSGTPGTSGKEIPIVSQKPVPAPELPAPPPENATPLEIAEYRRRVIHDQLHRARFNRYLVQTPDDPPENKYCSTLHWRHYVKR